MNLVQAEAKLRALNLTLTPQRRAILQHLENNPTHPTAQEIFAAVTREFPITSRATVYNSLALFKDLGIVREVVTAGGEVRYDMNTEAHHHYRCRGCGRLFDLPAERVKVELIPSPDDGFVVENFEVTIDGRCPACAPVAVPASAK